MIVTGPLHGTLAIGADGSVRYTPTGEYFGTDRFTYRASDGNAQSETVEVELTINAAPLVVTTFTHDADGFTVRFNHAVDPSVINLSSGPGVADADVLLTGRLVGGVAGTITLDDDLHGFTFRRTGAALQYDDYVVSLASGVTGFRDGAGALDGNRDGTAGDAYGTTFSRIGTGSAQIAMPDFMRGPGQAVNVPAVAQGIPLSFQSPGGVQTLVMHVDYDPALLSITGATRGSGMPAGATLQFGTGVLASGLARATFTIITDTPIAAGKVTLLNLTAFVPATAPYARKDLLKVGVAAINGDTLAPFQARDTLHVVGYFGDADGDAKLTTLDVQKLSRIVSGYDTKFAAWPQVNPLVVADINGDGRLTAIDTSLLLGKVRGQVRPEIPDIPLDLRIVFGGPDPLVDVSRTLSGHVGQIVTVPVRLDNAEFLEGAEFTLAYDPAVLELREVRRGSLTTGFEFYAEQLSPGLVRIDMAKMVALVGGRGSLLELDFLVRSAPAAGTALDLQAARLNASGLTLTYEPVVGEDPTDGWMTLLPAAPAPNVMDVMAGFPGSMIDPSSGRSSGTGVQVDWSGGFSAAPVAPPRTEVRTEEEWRRTAWARDLASRLTPRADPGNARGESTLANVLRPTSGRPR
jgi:hypothetical protein